MHLIDHAWHRARRPIKAWPLVPLLFLLPPHGFSQTAAPLGNIISSGKTFASPIADPSRPNKTRDFAVENITGPPGMALPLVITLPPKLPRGYAFVIIRGLPPTFALSAGLRTKEGWVVSPADVENLRLITPADIEGNFRVELELSEGKDQPPQIAFITITLSDAVGIQPATAEAKSRAPADSNGLPAHFELTPEESKIMEHADELLHTKDVAGARLLYARLAKMGNAQGALAMARTFDPKFLDLVPTAGIAADKEQARRWYLKAKDMGSQDAAARLEELGGN